MHSDLPDVKKVSFLSYRKCNLIYRMFGNLPEVAVNERLRYERPSTLLGSHFPDVESRLLDL